MSLADKVKIELADLADIDGITRVLDSVPLRRDFVYGPDCFKENVKYSFIQSIRHEHEGVYVAKEGDVEQAFKDDINCCLNTDKRDCQWIDGISINSASKEESDNYLSDLYH